MKEVKLPESSDIAIKHARILKGPQQIAFDLTYQCNFRCLHCYNLSGENYAIKSELTNGEVLKFIKEVSELKPLNFCFCGGEPLLRERILCEAAIALSESDVKVSLVTNGSLITKERARKLKESGVDRAQVSLDGARAETHNRLRQYKNAFELAVNAIRYFVEEGYEDISTAFIPTAFNYSEIEELFLLCRNLGVHMVRVQPLMILGRTNINFEEIAPTPLQYRELVKTIYELREKYGPHIMWGDPVDHIIRFRTVAQHCVNFVTVHANGDIVVSPYLRLTVGNIRKHSLKEYWQAGLAWVWEHEIIKTYAGEINSVAEFNKSRVWFEKNIELDIIDDNLFKKE